MPRVAKIFEGWRPRAQENEASVLIVEFRFNRGLPLNGGKGPICA
jgi:hypothetical protein